MPAFDMNHNKIKLFRLDRILALKNAQKKYNPGISLDNWLENLITQEPNNPVRLYAELTREGIRQCSSQPWLEPHIKITSEGHGNIDMKIDKSELEFVSKFFLQLGTAAKVIEPKEIIEIICRQLQDVLQHYS